MENMKILVANRGEIAVRIIRAAAELNIATVAMYSKDDTAALHCRMADEAAALSLKGPRAYMDAEQIIEIAKNHSCTAIHPGYGFLAENTEFARRCNRDNIFFIGPEADTLSLFGDKLKARNLAGQCDIPLLPATASLTNLQEAKDFFTSLGADAAMMIKALDGGGGRGMRPVFQINEIESAYKLCRSEALAAFGSERIYAEQLIPSARHIEVQVIGDAAGNICHLWERECSLQRRNQKIMEIAPSPTIEKNLREKLTDAAILLGKKAGYKGVGTVEFLVDADSNEFYFLEVNPRLQVEHTVTEEVTGLDLVKIQIQIAFGQTLLDLNLQQKDIAPPAGYAIQLRVNMEEVDSKGDIHPSSGRLESFYPPMGPGIRVDTYGYPGYITNPSFDSLLAKLICRSSSTNYPDVLAKAGRALREFYITGVATNIPILQNLISHPDVLTNTVTTGFWGEHIRELASNCGKVNKGAYIDEMKLAGTDDTPLSIISVHQIQGPENTKPVKASMPGTIVSISVAEGETVRQGQPVATIEAMKMHHIVNAQFSGIVRRVCADEGDTLIKNQPILFIEPVELDILDISREKKKNPDYIRPDLEEVISRHQVGMDEARPKAVEKRHKTGQRTARKNIADLLDKDSFIEYGALAVAAQRSRKSIDDLISKSPADGLVTGIGSVNGDLFGPHSSRCMVMSYDYTVMAGTQGAFNHQKTDRILGLAEKWRLPLVLFAEGGGGRPGDVDIMLLKVAGLDLDTFSRYARLSGLVPLVGIVSGRCFAGNATLLGCSDVIIATKNANIGMGGPAMIEGGGLGKYRPEEIGPINIQAPNGVVDIVTEDEAQAVKVAKKYLSYFQGSLSEWQCADQRLLRHCIPENRLLSYDIRKIICTLSDTDSNLELRKEFGVGIVTALIRLEGKPFGVIANNTMHLGGAIDADAADKGARFIQLCDAFDIPLISLSDTPGFMVGPEAEKSAQVRHFARMFVTAASASIPIFSVILRKGYGLGAMAMVGGGYHQPFFNVSWPTGEFGGMGLEGAVRLGFKKELDAAKTSEEKKVLFDSLVKMAYDHGKAVNMASFLEIDDVIDPKDTRRWIIRGAASLPPVVPRAGKKRPNIDTW